MDNNRLMVNIKIKDTVDTLNMANKVTININREVTMLEDTSKVDIMQDMVSCSLMNLELLYEKYGAWHTSKHLQTFYYNMRGFVCSQSADHDHLQHNNIPDMLNSHRQQPNHHRPLEKHQLLQKDQPMVLLVQRI